MPKKTKKLIGYADEETYLPRMEISKRIPEEIDMMLALTPNIKVWDEVRICYNLLELDEVYVVEMLKHNRVENRTELHLVLKRKIKADELWFQKKMRELRKEQKKLKELRKFRRRRKK